MKYFSRIAATVLTLAFVLGDYDIAGQQVSIGFFKIVADAEAKVGRPLTPVSVAGTARRTTRRVIRRGAYVAVIPAGCAYGTYYGYSLYYCGGVYYQKSSGGYVIVYF
jgi:hypothetical protein